MFKPIPKNFILAQLFLGIVIFFGIFFLIPTKTAMAQSWMAGEWDYRKSVTITNATTTQSNYQILFTLNTASLISAGKMKSSSCYDLRITDSGGTTTIPYWLESGCNSTSTRIWVKMSSIPTGTTTIFAYYGSSTATSLSNGSSTFYFFDDFTGTTIDTGKWTKVDTGSNISQNDELRIANGTAAWNTTGLYSVPSFNRSDSLVAQAKYKSTCAAGASYHDTTILSWKNTTANVDQSTFIYGLYFHKITSASPVLHIQELGTGRGWYGKFACNTQYWIRQILKTGGGATTSISTDEKNWSLIYDSSYDTTASLKVGFTHHQGGTTTIDDFLVRKYVSPEPTTKVEAEKAREVSCRPPISGNHTITTGAYCSFNNGAAGIYGVEEGNLTIEPNATLLIQAGQTFVWTRGFSVFVNGSIVIQKGTPGGQGRKGYLWMPDKDLDGYPATTSNYFSNSSTTKPTECLSDCRRRKWMSTMTEVDPSESNACSDSVTTHLCGYDNGSGSCVPTTTVGWYSSLSACEKCNGSSIDPVYVAKGATSTTCTGSCNFCDGNGICSSCGWVYTGNIYSPYGYQSGSLNCDNITKDNTVGYLTSTGPACGTNIYSSISSYPTYGTTYYELSCQCQ